MKCLVCGQEIVGKRSNAKYCSNKCLTEAKNQITRDSIRIKKYGRADVELLSFRKCEFCGEEYFPKVLNQLYCSKDCYREANLIRQKKKHKENYKKKELEPRVCIICGKTYIPRGHTQKCCSEKCSQVRAKDKNRERKKSKRKSRKSR